MIQLKVKMDEMKGKMEEQEEKIERLEVEQRKNNLKFIGIPEVGANASKSDDQNLAELFRKTMKIRKCPRLCKLHIG